MDFEIEDDSGEFTPYGRDPYSHNSGNSKTSAKKSGLFGGSYEEEDAYDFQYDAEQDYGKKSSKYGSSAKADAPAPIPAFSPRPEQGKHIAPPAREELSAMDRAAQMLSRYSSKPSGGPASSTQSGNNKYKTGRASLSFDEDELSAEDEEESEDVGEYGDLSISSPGAALKNFKPSMQAGAPVVAPKAAFTTSSSAFNASSKSLTATTSSNNLPKPSTQTSSYSKPAAVNKSALEVEESIEEDDDDEDEEYEDDLEEADETVEKSNEDSDGDDEDEEDYDNEEFDDIDEDVDGSESKPEPRGKAKASRSNSDGSDPENTSYSRMVYGNEEDDESEESLEESKPKILSFADLADMSGWEAPSLPAAAPPAATSAASSESAKGAGASTAATTAVPAAVPAVVGLYSAAIKPPVTVTEKKSTVQKMERTGALASQSAAAVASSASRTATPAAATATSTAVASSSTAPQTAAPPVASAAASAQSNTAARVDTRAAAALAPTMAASAVPASSNFAPAAPAAEPAAPSSSSTVAPTLAPPHLAASVTSLPSYPPPQPGYGYGYAPYPPPGAYSPHVGSEAAAGAPPAPPAVGGYPPYMSPYASYPYGMGPAMPAMPPMMGYGGYPPYGAMPFGGYPGMFGYAGYPPATLAGSALGRTSMAGGMGLAGGMSGPMGGAMESETSQRVIMELLTEFNKVKDEAEWSKKKLAEMIVLMERQQSQQPQQPQQPQQSSVPGGPTMQQQAKAALSSRDDVDESAADYSMDFVEVSHVHGAAPVLTTASSPSRVPQDPTERLSSSAHRPLQSTQQSWSPPKLRHSDSSLSNVLQGRSAPSTSSAAMDRGHSQYPAKSAAADRYRHSSGTGVSESAVFATDKENERPLAGRSLGSDPLSESVAKSFLASQELLRSKFEALRMKIQLSTTMHRSLREYEELARPRDEAKTSSSLDSFKQEAQRRRDEDARRLFALLREKYPEMQPQEILDLANKFGSL